MTTQDERDRLRACEEDLAIARRAHVRALESLFQLSFRLSGAQQQVERADDALKRRDLDDALKCLRMLRDLLPSVTPAGMRIIIDGEVASPASISQQRHRFCGMRHPPAPPESPQELDCTAIICTCLERLTNASQMRQHWEAGCFDSPHYETVEKDPELEELLKKIEANEKGL